MKQLKIKQRLIEITNRHNLNYSSRISPLLDVIRPYSLLGLQVATANAFSLTPSQAEFDRCHLEVSLSESKFDPMYAIDKIEHFSSWSSKRSETLRKFQIYYDISGLETTQDTINGQTHSYLWQSEEPLDVIPSDLKLLREQKKAIVDFFWSLVTPEMNLWEWDKKNNRWFKPYFSKENDVINNRLQKKVIEHLASTSFDDDITDPKMIFDWAQVYDRHDGSIILRLGRGCDLESYESTVAKFCASDRQPYQ